MSNNKQLCIICRGFNNNFDVPRVDGKGAAQFRTAIIIKKKDFYDGWEVYDAFLWRIVQRIISDLDATILIKCPESEFGLVKSLDELREWQKQQAAEDPDFGIDAPTEVRFFNRESFLCLMLLEDWSDIGKIEPYACSYTYSFYSYDVKVDAKVSASLERALDVDSEMVSVSHIQEEPFPKWYWPLINKLKSSNVFYHGMFCLMILALAGVLCISPSPSTYNKMHQCRRFLQKARYVLLAIDDKAMDMTFIEWREARGMVSLNEDLAAQICEYCDEYSSHADLKSFRSREIDGVKRLTDPWGQPYNVGLLGCFSPENIRRNLRNYTVGGIIMWSSGPNGINENGNGDDIFELPRNRWDQSDEADQ